MDSHGGQNISESLEDPDFPPQPCGMTHRLAEHPRWTFKFSFLHLRHQKRRDLDFERLQKKKKKRECFWIRRNAWAWFLRLLVWFPHGDVLSSPPLELLRKSIKATKRVAFRLNRCGFQGERAWRADRQPLAPSQPITTLIILNALKSGRTLKERSWALISSHV